MPRSIIFFREWKGLNSSFPYPLFDHLPDARAACGVLHRVAREMQMAEPAAWNAQRQQATAEENARRATIERADRAGQTPPYRLCRQSKMETAARLNGWLKDEGRAEWGPVRAEEQDLPNHREGIVDDRGAGQQSMDRNDGRIVDHIRIHPDIGPGINHFVAETPTLTLGLVVAHELDHQGALIRTPNGNIRGRVGILNADEMSLALVGEATQHMGRIDSPIRRDEDPEIARVARARVAVRAAANQVIETFQGDDPGALIGRIGEPMRSQWARYSPSWVRECLEPDAKVAAIETDASPFDETVPLTDREDALLSILAKSPTGLALSGKQIISKMRGLTQSSLTSRLVPGLNERGWGIDNRPQCGYYLTPAGRARFSRLSEAKARAGEP